MQNIPVLGLPLLCSLVLALVFGLPQTSSATQDEPSERDRRPSLALRANPLVSFSPARIVLLGELRGGADDYEDYYCAAVEWDWGDGTRSEFSYDCNPYEAGVSEIRRRFAAEHVYRTSGTYRIQIRLKRSDRTLTSASVQVQVRPGLRDIAGR